MSKMSYYDMNKCLCKELCCEFEKFEEDKNCEILKGIKDLLESMVYLNELEAAGAMRQYFEDEHGYDSKTSEFREQAYPRYGIYNNAPTYTNPNPMYRGNQDVMKRKMDGREYGRGYDYDDDRMNGRDMNRDSDMMRGVYNMAHMDGKEMPKKLTDHEKQEWLDSLQNEDGTVGETFSKDEARAIAKKVGAKFDNYTEEDFALVLNLVYSDMCDAIEKAGLNTDDLMLYGHMALSWLEDSDSYKPEEKIARYWKYIVKH